MSTLCLFDVGAERGRLCNLVGQSPEISKEKLGDQHAKIHNDVRAWLQRLGRPASYGPNPDVNYMNMDLFDEYVCNS